MIKPGVIVKFVSDTGQGRVVSFLSDRKIKVLHEDGFERIYPLKDLIEISPQSSENTEINSLSLSEFKHLNCLLLCPDSLNETKYWDLYFLPDFSEDFFLSLYSLGLSEYKILYGGILKPQKLVKICRIEGSELSYIKEFRMNVFVLHKTVKMPESQVFTFKIKNNQLFDESKYIETTHQTPKGLLLKYDSSILYDLSNNTDEIDNHLKDESVGFSVSKTSKPNQKRQEIVVDLHFYEMVEESKKVAVNEILMIQLEEFTRKLEQAIQLKAAKITFIHGVGKGTLKNEIRKRLKEYPQVKFYDAPLNKYGFGATEVIIL